MNNGSKMENLISQEEDKINLKCVFVGDGCAGKSLIIRNFIYNEVSIPYIPTVFENYSGDHIVDGETYRINIWDTAGQEDYDRLRPLSYPGTDVFVICFSIAEPASFENVKSWVKEVRHHSSAPIILVGNKQDLRNDPETIKELRERHFSSQPISFSEGEKLAEQIEAAAYLECSAIKSNSSKPIFDCIVNRGVIGTYTLYNDDKDIKSDILNNHIVEEVHFFNKESVATVLLKSAKLQENKKQIHVKYQSQRKLLGRLKHWITNETIYRTDEDIGFLFHCAEYGKLNILKDYLRKTEENINSTNTCGRTALSVAVQNTQYDVVDFLLTKKVDINVIDQSGWTCLFYCCQNGNISMLLQLLQSGARVDIVDKAGQSAISLLTQKYKQNIIKEVLLTSAFEKIEPNLCKKFFNFKSEQTFLHAIMKYYQDEYYIISMIEEFKNVLDVNAVDNSNVSILHRSIIDQRFKITKYLCQRPDIVMDLEDDNGFTPFQYFIKQDNVEMLKWTMDDNYMKKVLLESKKNLLALASEMSALNSFTFLMINHLPEIGMKDKNGNSVFHLAAFSGSIMIMSKMELWVNNASLDVNDMEQTVFLSTLACQGKEKERLMIVKMLFEMYPNDIMSYLMKTDSRNNNCLWYIAKNHHTEILIYLFQEYKTVLESMINDGPTTPLWIATNYRFLDILQIFIKYDSNIMIQCEDGRSPIETCIIKNDLEITKMFYMKTNMTKDILLLCARFGNIELFMSLCNRDCCTDAKKYMSESEFAFKFWKEVIEYDSEDMLLTYLGYFRSKYMNDIITRSVTENLQKYFRNQKKRSILMKNISLGLTSKLSAFFKSFTQPDKNLNLKMITKSFPLFNEDISEKWEKSVNKSDYLITQSEMKQFIMGPFCIGENFICEESDHKINGPLCLCKRITLRERLTSLVSCSDSKCQPIVDLLQFVKILEEKINEPNYLQSLSPRFILVGSVNEGTRVGIPNEADFSVDFVRLRTCFKIENNALEMIILNEFREELKQFSKEVEVNGEKISYLVYALFLNNFLQNLHDCLPSVLEDARCPETLTINMEEIHEKCKVKTEFGYMTNAHCSDDNSIIHAPAVTTTKSGPCLTLFWKKPENLRDYSITDQTMTVDFIPIFHIINKRAAELTKLISNTLQGKKPLFWAEHFLKAEKGDKILPEILTNDENQNGMFVSRKFININDTILVLNKDLDFSMLSGKLLQVYCMMKYLKDAYEIPVKSILMKSVILLPQNRTYIDSSKTEMEILYEILQHGELRHLFESVIDFDTWYTKFLGSSSSKTQNAIPLVGWYAKKCQTFETWLQSGLRHDKLKEHLRDMPLDDADEERLMEIKWQELLRDIPLRDEEKEKLRQVKWNFTNIFETLYKMRSLEMTQSGEI